MPLSFDHASSRKASHLGSRVERLVADAEQTLAAFEIERTDLLARQGALADKRRLAAFDAHSGDAQASKLLDGLHEEAIQFESRLARLDDAIAEGRHQQPRTSYRGKGGDQPLDHRYCRWSFIACNRKGGRQAEQVKAVERPRKQKMTTRPFCARRPCARET